MGNFVEGGKKMGGKVITWEWKRNREKESRKRRMIERIKPKKRKLLKGERKDLMIITQNENEKERKWN